MSNRDSIIETLINARGATISGETLASSSGVSRTTIWKDIRLLIKEGYDIEIKKGKGYRLLKLTNDPLEREIKRGLSTEIFGTSVIYFPELESSNDFLKNLGRDGANEGTIVVAKKQTKGRGRMGREWVSPDGGIYMSILVRPQIHPSEIVKLTLLTAVAIVKTLQELYNLNAKIKWPNDIMINDKKVAGVLSEMEAEAEKANFVVIGIGIDVNCDVEVEYPTTSLKEELGKTIDLTSLIQGLLIRFEDYYREFKINQETFLKEYKQNSGTIGRKVKVTGLKDEIEGTAVDIDMDGGLMVRTESGDVEKILSGDCIYLRNF